MQKVARAVLGTIALGIIIIGLELEAVVVYTGSLPWH